jgi:hypothetical protein
MEGSTNEGLALVGSGSEWFWIALQFFALAGTLYAIYRQLRAQQIEIQESTKAQLSLGYNNAILLGQRPIEMLVQDETLAKIADVGYATPEKLNAVQWARFGNFMFLQFNAWEYFFYQQRDHQIPNELFVGADMYYRTLIDTKPGLSRFWTEWQATYDEPFRSYVGGYFEKPPAPVAA